MGKGTRDRSAIGRGNKQRGTVHELRTQRDLEHAGYGVLRARGSLGPADLIAGFLEETWAIQVKSMEPRPKDIMEIQAASRRWWVYWTIVWKPKRKDRIWISFHRGRPIEAQPRTQTEGETHGTDQGPRLAPQEQDGPPGQDEPLRE